jgi:hypothetical protein
MMTWNGVEARIVRLGDVAMGLRRDGCAAIGGGNPMTGEERSAYAKELREAGEALERARTVLYGATRRRYAEEKAKGEGRHGVPKPSAAADTSTE